MRSAQKSPPTVATKLLVPLPARHLIERGRLYDVLDEGVTHGVVLLSAPAGAGKTVLLSSWIAARQLPGPPCWLSLDADDNDPVRLLDDLLSALRRPASGPLEALVAPTGASTERFLALLVNALTELHAPLVLVLDEVHELTSPRATAALDYLVRHAPPQLRIVIAGRADPPLHIERLRAGGALTQLRITDLAFNREETATLCGQLELPISEQELEALWVHTEGWPAAVCMAALSLREHPEPARFLADFAGTDRAVADYLIAEVLARLPAPTREFMLHTCVVDAVSPELADALTGGEGGTLPLAELERMGAPVQPTAVDGRWYRYHPLFGELLRAHLRHAHPEQIPALHRRAARWYAEQREAMPAIRHALAGEDWEQAGCLIAEHWLELFLHGGAAAMRGPLAQLPPAVVAADPRLAAALAGTRLQEGDLGDAERLLALARESRKPPRELLTAVALRHARLRVQPDDAARLAEELNDVAHRHTHRCRTALRGFALCDLGATLLWSGADVGAAVAHLDEALALVSEHGYELIALDCLAQLAMVHVLRGELTRGEQLSARATELAERHGWCGEPAAAAAHLAAGTCAYRRGEFERAEGLLARAVGAADAAEPPVRLAVSLMQAYALAAAGERSAVAGALKLGAIRSELADGVPAPPFLERVLDAAEPRVLIAAGEVERARATLAAALQRTPDSVALLVRQASLELHDGEPELARASLARAHARAAEQTPPPSPGTVLEGWVLRAVAEHGCGETRAAFEALDRALALAEREPFRDAFLLSGPAVRDLLELQAREGTAHPALLEVLLDGVGEVTAHGGALSEPLTEREQRILRYLPTMLTNAEIGAEVFVSLNTVKTHLRSIYRKLDANGRADAVEKARRLGLLPAGIKRPRVVQRV
ncbi:MAG TPA: LuxR C-terminal-related transcriptional regulator [Solirubrobacteraceae bacterium]|nr:LuxR C-terminal-related transcriptional regulator [Solirubrobacteraceae bacterium]